jgi:hypothetical protein
MKTIAFLNREVNHSMPPEVEAGYANGYVAVPPEHPLYGTDGVIVEEGILDVIDVVPSVE